ncbi:hypothetical protein BFG52_03445 [Acinetobacter larvae]|uniref:Uncharacterized protein n=1 Tax=Acinetobacter larvae TaxID=1789224 RepID=A0A1B2LX41_9GAMM|nr:hypothetical protein BFG52_03445 [Acinetobacter larvae]
MPDVLNSALTPLASLYGRSGSFDILSCRRASPNSLRNIIAACLQVWAVHCKKQGANFLKNSQYAVKIF